MRRAGIVVLVGMALAMAGCGSDGESAAATGGVRVTDAWARSSVPDMGAAYMTITNEGSQDDRLLSIDAGDLGSASVHETVMDGEQAMMQPVEGIDVPAGQTVMLEPGGYHVMLMDLSAPLEVGSTIELTASFERAGDVTVRAEVRAMTDDGTGGM